MRFIILTISLTLGNTLLFADQPSLETRIDCARPVTLDCAQNSIEKYLHYRTRSQKTALHVFRWLLPLNRGQILSSGLNNNTPSPIGIKSPTWFFYADHQPGAIFEHKTEFILVDILRSTLVVYQRKSWPKLDKLDLFTTQAELSEPLLKLQGYRYSTLKTAERGILRTSFPGPSNPDNFPDPINWDEVKKKYPPEKDEIEKYYRERVQSYLEKPMDKAFITGELNKCSCPTNSPPGKKYAIVVNGGRLPLHYSEALVKSLRTQGVETWSLHPNLPFNEADPGQANAKDMETNLRSLQYAFASLAAKINSCCDQVFIYINAHGGSNAIMNMNPYSETPILHTTGPNRGKPIGGTFAKEGSKLGGNLSSKELAALLNTLRTCMTKVYLSSCHAGSHFTKGNINTLPATAKHCLCRTVYASSTARQITWSGQNYYFLEEIMKGKSFSDAALAHWNYFRKLSLEAISEDDLKYKVDPRVQSTDCILCDDRDGDGLFGHEEVALGTDPSKADTDGDGLSDFSETRGTVRSNPLKKDSDGDGLLDPVELERGTNPLNPDTDGDGVTDNNEIFGGTDPRNPDTDGDGLNDGDEYRRETSPLKPDTDGDGLNDGDEVKKYRTNPLNKDTDGDGMNDFLEVTQGTNPNVPN